MDLENYVFPAVKRIQAAAPDADAWEVAGYAMIRDYDALDFEKLATASDADIQKLCGESSAFLDWAVYPEFVVPGCCNEVVLGEMAKDFFCSDEDIDCSNDFEPFVEAFEQAPSSRCSVFKRIWEKRAGTEKFAPTCSHRSGIKTIFKKRADTEKFEALGFPLHVESGRAGGELRAELGAGDVMGAGYDSGFGGKRSGLGYQGGCHGGGGLGFAGGSGGSKLGYQGGHEGWGHGLDFEGGSGARFLGDDLHGGYGAEVNGDFCGRGGHAGGFNGDFCGSGGHAEGFNVGFTVLEDMLEDLRIM